MTRRLDVSRLDPARDVAETRGPKKNTQSHIPKRVIRQHKEHSSKVIRKTSIC